MWAEATEGLAASPSLDYLGSCQVRVYSLPAKPNQVKAWHSLQMGGGGGAAAEPGVGCVLDGCIKKTSSVGISGELCLEPLSS